MWPSDPPFEANDQGPWRYRPSLESNIQIPDELTVSSLVPIRSGAIPCATKNIQVLSLTLTKLTLYILAPYDLTYLLIQAVEKFSILGRYDRNLITRQSCFLSSKIYTARVSSYPGPVCPALRCSCYLLM
jgi:hypothetical protein